MSNYGAIVLLSALVLGSVLLLRNYPTAQRHLPLVRWFVRLFSTSLEYWGFKKAFSDERDFVLRHLCLLEALKLDTLDLREARKQIGAFVADAYGRLNPGKVPPEYALRAATAGYMAVLSYEEIRDTLDGLKDHENLDVRKATYVIIDVLGELFDRSDELSREYFQHLVYGFNKCLVLFRDGGKAPDTMREIYAVLWRMYKLTKAYNKALKSEGLSKEEFYEKLRILLGVLSNALSGE